MTVTNNIKDSVSYDNITGWSETPISNDEIEKKLQDEKKKGFLSFSYRLLDNSDSPEIIFSVTL